MRKEGVVAASSKPGELSAVGCTWAVACINPEGKRNWAGLEEVFLMREKKGYCEMEIHNVRQNSGNL